MKVSTFSWAHHLMHLNGIHDLSHEFEEVGSTSLPMHIPEKLIKKYNVPAPRYTSYPTVPHWDYEQLPSKDWTSQVKSVFKRRHIEDGISLYIHLPYCESLCTYCACNTRITKNHSVEEKYINTLLKEWEQYVQLAGKKPVIRELHLGGGTPTFFSPENLVNLIEGIMRNAVRHEKASFSFEGHPNNTTYTHLKALHSVGFDRVSYGVQDLDNKVQKVINRIQPFEKLVEVTNWSRELGYTSVNFDLIYGLPFQTENSVMDTIEKVMTLKPERIAFYSYAHVPWKKPGQRAYTEIDLPDNDAKRKLYELGKEMLTNYGYQDVGMDHFALEGDELYKAYITRTLHRNFMGYNAAKTSALIGLGASAISDLDTAYAQNEKKVEDYISRIEAGGLAITKGHLMTNEDRIIRDFILDIACKGEVKWSKAEHMIDFNMNIELLEMTKEGLVKLYGNGMRVTDLGMAFIRNICMVFDKRLKDKETNQPQFSKAI